jgi:hypothetical protein
MNTVQTHSFQAQIQGQFKRQKKIQDSKQMLQKTYNPKIWILQNLEKINAQICKNRAVNGQQKFGKEKKL